MSVLTLTLFLKTSTNPPRIRQRLPGSGALATACGTEKLESRTEVTPCDPPGYSKRPPPPGRLGYGCQKSFGTDVVGGPPGRWGGGVVPHHPWGSGDSGSILPRQPAHPRFLISRPPLRQPNPPTMLPSGRGCIPWGWWVGRNRVDGFRPLRGVSQSGVNEISGQRKLRGLKPFATIQTDPCSQAF